MTLKSNAEELALMAQETGAEVIRCSSDVGAWGGKRPILESVGDLEGPES